jgi:hypothetical protein
MERSDFIAEAKKLGMEDSEIQGRLEIYDDFASGGITLEFLLDSFEGPFLNPSEIDITCRSP